MYWTVKLSPFHKELWFFRRPRLARARHGTVRWQCARTLQPWYISGGKTYQLKHFAGCQRSLGIPDREQQGHRGAGGQRDLASKIYIWRLQQWIHKGEGSQAGGEWGVGGSPVIWVRSSKKRKWLEGQGMALMYQAA